MEEIIGFIIGIFAVLLFIIALPFALLISTPFILLIPGKEYCTTCGENECNCNSSKVKNKKILSRYGKIFSIWGRIFEFFPF